MNIDDRPTIDQRPTTDLRANSHILGKFQMAITLQRVSRSPLCLVLGWGFRGRRIERRHFRFDQIQDGSRRPSWKTSNGHISVMHRTIDFVFRFSLGFSGTYLSNALSDSLCVCTQTQIILCRRSLIYNDGDVKLIS